MHRTTTKHEIELERMRKRWQRKKVELEWERRRRKPSTPAPAARTDPGQKPVQGVRATAAEPAIEVEPKAAQAAPDVAEPLVGSNRWLIKLMIDDALCRHGLIKYVLTERGQGVADRVAAARTSIMAGE